MSEYTLYRLVCISAFTKGKLNFQVLQAWEIYSRGPSTVYRTLKQFKNGSNVITVVLEYYMNEYGTPTLSPDYR